MELLKELWAELRGKISGWWHGEGEKLRGMNWKQKVSYVTTYYKGVFFGLLCVALLGFYVGDIVVQSQKEILLQGFIANDEWDLFSAEKMEAEYGATLTLEKHQRIVFDDGLYIDMTGQNANEYTSASNAKLLAYVTTKELDLIIATRDVLDYYTGEMPMRDLKELLPTELFAALEDQMVTGTDEAGNTVYIAVDMTGSRYVANSEYAGEDGVRNNYFLFIPNNSQRAEQAAAFIAYCFAADGTAE